MNITIAPSRWYRLIPVAFITYSLAYLDRANFGFAAAGEMAKDLHITAATSSLLGSLFFLGYFFFQIPGAHYAANKSAKKLIFWSLILWGALAAATGLVSNITLLMIVRFMLGVVESAVMPAMIILLSRWFTKQERSRANTFLILGNPVTILWMSIVSGYLVNAAGWLSSLPYAFAIIGMITASYFSDKTLNRKIFVWPFLFVASLAFYGSYLAGTNNFWLSFVLLVIAGTAMYAPYGPFFAILTEMLPANVTAGA